MRRTATGRLTLKTALVAAAVLAAAAARATFAVAAPDEQAEKPNVILVLTDDR